jgi:uncharacterized protein
MTEAFCLLVVAKAPIEGFAKTRLCPPASPRQAAEIAAAALLDTLDAVAATPGAVPVVATAGELADGVRTAELARAVEGMSVIRQHGRDFGERLANAHADVADLLDLPVVQIGMDTPQVTADLFAHSAACLLAEAHDAVLGPAEDGGWWALGLRDPRVAEVLTEVPMSRPDTGSRTLHALTGAGLRTAPLQELSDVDTMRDARRVAARSGGRFAEAVAEVSE